MSGMAAGLRGVNVTSQVRYQVTGWVCAGCPPRGRRSPPGTLSAPEATAAHLGPCRAELRRSVMAVGLRGGS